MNTQTILSFKRQMGFFLFSSLTLFVLFTACGASVELGIGVVMLMAFGGLIFLQPRLRQQKAVVQSGGVYSGISRQNSRRRQYR